MLAALQPLHLQIQPSLSWTPTALLYALRALLIRLLCHF